MGQDETRALSALRVFRKEILRPTVGEHRGDVVNSMGDGWLIEFSSIVDAVSCAVLTATTMKPFIGVGGRISMFETFRSTWC